MIVPSVGVYAWPTFSSDSSHDRPWAERLYGDLRLRFPNIQVFWDHDRDSLPQGDPFRPALKEAAKTSTHFVVLWSQKAKDSNEVGPEIGFDQHKDGHPEINHARRRLFYVPLDASDYGFLKDVQGTVAIREYLRHCAGRSRRIETESGTAAHAMGTDDPKDRLDRAGLGKV